jgi:hypothetical protein
MTAAKFMHTSILMTRVLTFNFNGKVYGKLGIKMCYPIEPNRSKLKAQNFK